jgi:rhodanese-related sulfurtransferase
MKNLVSFIAILMCLNGFCQNTIPEVLKQFNKETVSYISTDELKNKKNIVLLDTREPNEYYISHIKNAKCVGYDKFRTKTVTNLVKDKNTTIVVYCSIGIRSEQIGEKILKMGYKNVYNLYGGIFEWKNKGENLVDNNDQNTNMVHAFSKEWSKYLTNGEKYFENQKKN